MSIINKFKFYHCICFCTLPLFCITKPIFFWRTTLLRFMILPNPVVTSFLHPMVLFCKVFILFFKTSVYGASCTKFVANSNPYMQRYTQIITILKFCKNKIWMHYCFKIVYILSSAFKFHISRNKRILKRLK